MEEFPLGIPRCPWSSLEMGFWGELDGTNQMVVVEYREIFPLLGRPKTQVKEFEGEEREVAEVVKAKVFGAEAVLGTRYRGDLPAEPVVIRMVLVVGDLRPDDSGLVSSRDTS